MSRNLAASIRERLKRRADAVKQDFNLTLTRYGLERLLYRLSVSTHADRFLLKGALLFALWNDQPHRPTRDADLLGYGPDDIDSMVEAFREICAVAVDDGVAFDGYPVLLDDLPAPRLRAYPKATVIAEKLHAICLLGMANTRMKDYFDLDVLLAEPALDAAELRQAIGATFARRRLALPDDWPAGLSETFAGDPIKRMQWTAFLRKNRLEATELADVVERLRAGFAKLGQPGPT